MKVVCAWCDRDLGEKAPYEDPMISHGMCDDCRDMMKMRRELRDQLKDHYKK